LGGIRSQLDTRKALLESLTEKGYGNDQLAEISRMIDAEKSDLFDVLAYIAFALAPITREERVSARRENIFSQYDDKLRAFLDFVLSQYVQEGVGELAEEKLPHLLTLKYRAVTDAAEQLGGVSRIRDAFIGFQKHLYQEGS
jgi:type I restriction enzyme R subunit